MTRPIHADSTVRDWIDQVPLSSDAASINSTTPVAEPLARKRHATWRASVSQPNPIFLTESTGLENSDGRPGIHQQGSAIGRVWDAILRWFQMLFAILFRRGDNSG